MGPIPPCHEPHKVLNIMLELSQMATPGQPHCRDHRQTHAAPNEDIRHSHGATHPVAVSSHQSTGAISFLEQLHQQYKHNVVS